jgi:hypothetical protein
MACATPVGDNLAFGIAADEASLVTQSVEVTHGSDKKEARDKCGNVIAVAYYNGRADINISGLGQSAELPGAILALAGSFGAVGTVCIDEVSIRKNNEGFVETQIKATGYKHIV